jgi:hypothetical protein
VRINQDRCENATHTPIAGGYLWKCVYFLERHGTSTMVNGVSTPVEPHWQKVRRDYFELTWTAAPLRLQYAWLMWPHPNFHYQLSGFHYQQHPLQARM